MKTAILQVETYDDVASIRDKILWCRSQRILLVLPRQKRAFPNRLDLNQIERSARENGAKLGVVSRSDITREYAQSLGIPVFRSIPEAERGTWLIDFKTQETQTGLRGKEAVLKMRQDLPVVDGVKPLHPKLRLALMVISLAALVALFIFLIPSATIIVYPETRTQEVSLDIHASTEVTQANIAGLLPAYDERVTVTGQKTINSSGTVIIGKEKASGEVTIRNLTTEELAIPAGTIVATGGEPGLRFATQEDLILPVGDEGMTVTVEALKPGEEGNIEPGQIALLEGSIGSMVDVSNSTPFIGGVSTKANAPTESDYIYARALLLQELEAKAMENANTSSVSDKSPIRETLALNEVVMEEKANPIGEPSDTLTLNMTADFNLLLYDAAQLNILVEDVLDLSIPEGYHDVESAAEIKNQGSVSVKSEKEASWRVEASRAIAKNLTADKIMTSIKGKKKSDAIRILNEEFPHLKSAEVVAFVKWWPWLPLLTGRMNMVEGSINGG